jgi:hypothetical protein
MKASWTWPLVLVVLPLCLLVSQTAEAFYNPGTGRWLNRDPLNVLTSTETRYELLRSCGQAGDAARSMAESSEEPTEYVFGRNAPIMLYDLLGLCVPLPDSGPGTFHGNFFGHRFGGPASSLTFRVCCPALYPYLATWGIMSPLPPPPVTPHGNNFPGNWTPVTPPRGDGPCYTIVINVTSTSTVNRWIGDPFIESVRVTGGCCCQKSSTIQRRDPPVTPPGPPAPPPPITPPGVTIF